MSQDFIAAQIKASMLRITVITGCQLTADVSMRNVFYSELQKMLNENYSFLTFAEIETAFRMAAANGNANPYNNILNLQFIGQVLSDYKKTRGEALKAAEFLLPKPKQEVMSWEEITEVEYQDFLKGECVKKLIPEGVYQCCYTYGWVGEAKEKSDMQDMVFKFFGECMDGGRKNLFERGEK